MPTAYIVDDSPLVAESLAQMLRLWGYEAEAYLGPRPAIDALAQAVPDVIFLDLHMQGIDGGPAVTRPPPWRQ